MPPPVDLSIQHLKFVGPGHWLDNVSPSHCDVQRQLPPLPHAALVQHLISFGVPGQALLMYFPPADEHFAVGMHTPGALPWPEQGPFKTDR